LAEKEYTKFHKKHLKEPSKADDDFDATIHMLENIQKKKL